ncbi:hypothetical protein Bhyg_11151 [Pseudolycoriella hygida]|uniref:Uncharacterized protein n=1 Tax=Pseudolycoriella hygida TaxID=35572 RepID=A0A9Q0RZN4_9DIPT|nr:hypothetical protein Bhyg_11151 [Pseudolycoriella hygida]
MVAKAENERTAVGQQQQFHFAFGQRPFHFPADPLSGFRMPPIGNCQNMSQFGLGGANSHWGYSSAGYSPYLTSSSLTSCATPSAAQFNNPALGFSCTSDQNSAQDFAGSGRDCVPMLPDSTATDLDQHLSNLVGTAPTAQMTHPSLLAGSQTCITTSVNGSSGLHVPRYLGNSNSDYVHTSQNGPRSLSDSSQAESPVQDDLLTSNTPNLGGSANQNFSGIVVNQSQNSYGSTSASCNGSLYPVLPASLLYSQLYTAANQSHGFHSHSLQSHGQNSVHGELQSVMEHISSGRQQNLMAGTTDLSHVGNCGSSARNEEASANRQVAMAGQRPPHHSQSDNGNSVWRPY